MSVIADIHKDLEEGAIRLIAEHRDCLFAEAVRMCKDASTAEDLVSRTFAKAIQKIDSHDESRSLAAWLKTIMQNLYRNDMKRPVVRGTDPIDPAELERMDLTDWSSDEQLLKNSDSEALREAIGRLDPKFKQVLVMHYFSELPVKAIASALNMPVGTVLWRLNIARKILAKDLAEKLGKKPLALLAVLFLGAATLFGAWTAGLGEWVEEAFSAPTAEMAQTSDSAPTSAPGETSAAQSNAEEPATSNSISQNLSTEQEKTPMNTISPMKSLKKTVLAATMLATTAFTASAEVGENLIQNGSFEEGMSNVNYGKYVQTPTLNPPTGWSVSDTEIYGIHGTQDGNKGDGTFVNSNLEIRDRNYCLALQKRSTISTTVSVAIPGHYKFTAYAVARPATGGNPIDIYFDGTKTMTIPSPATDKWTEYSSEDIFFDAGTYTLKLQGTETRDRTTVVDDLSLCLVEASPKVHVRVACPENVTYVATVNGAEIGEEAYVGQKVEVRATPTIVGKAYASVPAGWTLQGASIVKTFTVGDEGLEINIPEEGLVDVSAGFSRTFEITASGYNGATLDDFPALVRLSTSISKFSYDDFLLPNGGDLRFTTEEGVPLAHEIDTWNEAGESLVWVKVPSLAKEVKIIAYYGNATPWAVNATAVWSDYAGVWHFAQFDTSDTTTNSKASSPNSTAEEGIDAHIAKTTGTKIDQEGFFGTGVQTADTGSGAGLWMKDAGANSPLDGGAQFTISGWFKHMDVDYSWDHIFYKRSRSNNAQEATNPYVNAFAIEVGGNKDAFPVDARGSGSKSGAKTPSVNPKGTWVQLTFVYDNTTCRFYENGTLVDNIAIDACVDNDAPLAVGNNSNYEINDGIDSPWKGWVDEVRFSKGVKSADWVAAEYKCALGDILSMGEVQTIVSADQVTVMITADDSKETYTATANDEPVTSGGAVSSNAMVTVVATPKTDYLYFPVPEGWTKGTEEKTITAKFRAENDPTMIEIPDPTAIADVRVKVMVEPPQHGTITGAEDEYEYGAQATLTAVPDDAFVFAGWTGAAEGETANPLTLTMDDNKTIGAIFKPIDLIKNGSFEEGIGDSIPVGGVKNPPSSLPTGMTGGSDILAVRGKGDRSGDGSVIPASIKIYDGYYTVGFARNGWYSMNVEVTRPGLYELTVHKIARLGYTGGTVDVYCDDDKCTTISAAGTSAWETETKTFKLPMGTHALKFQHVSSNGQTLLDDLSLCLVEEDPKHTVNFANTESQTYTATVLGNEVKDGDQVYENSIVTVTATPAEGYGYGTAPEGWTESGASITKDFTIVADTAITIPEAQPLADVKYTLTLAPCTWGSIAGKSGEFSAGETTELTAIPEDDDFCFAGWTGAAEGETANPLTVTMDGNKTIGAIFKPVNLIKNGSFEDCEDDIGPGKFKDDGNFTRPTGWEGGRVLIRGKDSGAGDGTYVGDGTYITDSEKLPDGEYCLGFKYAYSLSTSVAVKKPGRYTLTIQKIRRKSLSWSGNGIGVFFDDAKIGEISAPSDSKWEEQSFEVRLGPGEHTLKFTPPNNWDQSIFLDDISFVLQEELPAEVVVDTEHVSQTFNYQNAGVERSINVKVEVPSAGYTIKYSTTEEGEYTTDPIKYWQAGEYTIYYRVEAEGMEPAAGFGTVTIGENWVPNGSFEDGTWISNNNYGILNNANAGTEVWVNTKDSGKENGDICRARDGSPFLGNVPAADGSYAYIATLNNQISAPINLARSGKYQFSCKYMCRVNYNTIYEQTAVVKIDGVAVATVPSTEEKTKWLDFSSEKFQLKKGEHTITIEGTTSKDSTILLDALRLDFKGGNGLLIMLN